jgi:hypothetical protein
MRRPRRHDTKAVYSLQSTPRIRNYLAEDARTRRRRQDHDADTLVEARYAEIRTALDWYVDTDQPDTALRLASALTTFWIATKRIDEGDAWFGRTLPAPNASGPTRARSLHDHGYLVFWAGRYELAGQRFQESLALARARSATRRCRRSPSRGWLASPSTPTPPMPYGSCVRRSR